MSITRITRYGLLYPVRGANVERMWSECGASFYRGFLLGPSGLNPEYCMVECTDGTGVGCMAGSSCGDRVTCSCSAPLSLSRLSTLGSLTLFASLVLPDRFARLFLPIPAANVHLFPTTTIHKTVSATTTTTTTTPTTPTAPTTATTATTADKRRPA